MPTGPVSAWNMNPGLILTVDNSASSVWMRAQPVSKIDELLIKV